MNIKTNNMVYKLNTHEVSELKNLIFDKIDQVGGLDLLSPELYSVLMKFCSEKAPEVLQTKGSLVTP